MHTYTHIHTQACIHTYTYVQLKVQLKFKLDNRCSNNQAEQLATAKALEVIDAIDIAENSPHTTAIFTDSRIAMDSLKNVNNPSYLIEEIRKRIYFGKNQRDSRILVGQGPRRNLRK
jgi:ribonuclease HI